MHVISGVPQASVLGFCLRTDTFPYRQHLLFLPLSQGPATGSFWTVTDHEPGLSSKYGDVPLTLQVFSQSCEKLSDATNTLI